MVIVPGSTCVAFWSRHLATVKQTHSSRLLVGMASDAMPNLPPMCALAKKVPVMKAAGLNHIQRADESFRRDALVELINYLYDEPSIITTIRDYVKKSWLNSKMKSSFGKDVESMGNTIDAYDEDLNIAFLNKN